MMESKFKILYESIMDSLKKDSDVVLRLVSSIKDLTDEEWQILYETECAVSRASGCDVLDFDKFKKWFEESDKESIFFSIEDEFIGSLNFIHEKKRNYIWIQNFAIFPEFRGKGFGRKALTKSIELIREIPEFEDSDICLGVETKNKIAISLYESLGFKTFESGNEDGKEFLHMKLDKRTTK